MESFRTVRRVFLEIKYQKQIEEEGYCLLPLFTDKEIEELEEVYKSNKVSEQPSIELTLKSEDYELKKRIAEGISNVIHSKVTSLLDGYVPIFNGFITKIPGRDNVSALHQDPTVTDEEKYTSVNVWIPLTDVDEQNGAVHIVKRSHLFFQGFRSNRIGKYDFSEIKTDVMKRFGTVVKMKKGDALIYDTRLFHFSNQNVTDKLRIATASIYIPVEATPIYYYHNLKDNLIEVYEISREFYLNYVDRFFRGSIVDEKLIASSPYKVPERIDLNTFKMAYEKYNCSSLWNRIKFFKHIICGYNV